MFSAIQQNLFLMTSYVSDYQSCLLKLYILPLLMQHELNDIWVFCQIPQTSTQLLHHHAQIMFLFSGNKTRSDSHHKLVQPMATINQLFQTLLL